MAKSPHAESYFHLHLISDATGETLIAVGRAAAAQYATVSPVEHIYSLVRSPKRLEQVVAEIEANPGVVLYTLVDHDLAHRLETRCRELGVPSLSVLAPVLALFQSYLGAETTPRVGGQHTLNAEYFRRIDALNFTMMHDDGQHPENLEEADVVLVGVSRTSKTPTSIYLANRGIKTANVPLGAGRLTCPRSSRPWCGPWWSGYMPRPSASFRFGRIVCSASIRRSPIPLTWIARRCRKKSPSPSNSAPVTAGRRST